MWYRTAIDFGKLFGRKEAEPEKPIPAQKPPVPQDVFSEYVKAEIPRTNNEIINGLGDHHLILTGTESTDARMSVIPAMLSERLDMPHLSFAGEVSVDVNAKIIKTKRMTDEGVEAMESTMPVIVTVIEKINEPRYPSFKGIMAAKKKPITNKSLSDLGLSVDLVKPWSAVNNVTVLPPRSSGIKIEDSGDAGSKLADFLAEKKLI